MGGFPSALGACFSTPSPILLLWFFRKGVWKSLFLHGRILTFSVWMDIFTGFSNTVFPKSSNSFFLPALVPLECLWLDILL